jgi:TolB protein
MVITDLPLKTGAGSFDPAWSPDGKTLLYTVIIGKDTEIRSIHLPDNKITTLANRGTKNAQPAWSRDGEYIAFISSDDIHNDALWLMRKNGDSQEILSSAGAFSEPAWAPDGTHILVSLNKGNNVPILAWFDRSNPTQPEVDLLPDVYRMSYGSISPDGQWLIFWSDHVKNNPELFLITRDGKTLRQITNNLLRDFQPAWSPQ